MIYFTAHTFKCVCHCRRAMFRVLGMYNFELYQKSTIWHLVIWQNWCFGQFYHQKLKSKHLAISVFSGQRVFWGNERKYFPHILGLRTLRGSLYHIQLTLEYLVGIFCMLPCISSKSSCLGTCPSSLAFCIS